MAKLFANTGDPDQTPRSAASDLVLHCLPITLLRVSQLQWVKMNNTEERQSGSFCYRCGPINLETELVNDRF